MSENAISRQAVKDWFCTNYCSEHNKCEHFEKGECNAMIELFSIPPVKLPIVEADEIDEKESDDYDEEPYDLDMGFDPYMGCYTDDC